MEDEHQIGGLYREHLKRELARPELAREKREFIARHFEGGPLAALSPAAFAPALSLVVLLVALVFLQQGVPEKTKTMETRPEAAYTLSESILPLPASATTAVRDERPVVVKRLSSRAGSTLVYQKSYQETPITIVWVFVP